MCVRQNVFLGVFLSTGSTMETQGPTAESGGVGGQRVLMHDVGSARRTLPVAEDRTPPARPSTYRAPPACVADTDSICRTPGTSRRSDAKVLKTSCGNGNCCLRAPWLDNLTDDFRSNWHSGHSGRRVGSRARVPGGNPTNVPEGRF